MKKSAALTFAIFYMLLTTGMFVCIMHCASQMLLSKAGFVAEKSRSKVDMHDCCHAKKVGDCCKKQGNYEVKENIKPGFDYIFALNAPAIKPVANVFAPNNAALVTNTRKAVITEPPWKTGWQRSIQLRSIQI